MYQFRLLYTLFIHKCEATRRTSLGTLSVSRSLSMHAAWMCISVCVCLCVRCAALQRQATLLFAIENPRKYTRDIFVFVQSVVYSYVIDTR